MDPPVEISAHDKLHGGHLICSAVETFIFAPRPDCSSIRERPFESMLCNLGVSARSMNNSLGKELVSVYELIF